MVFVAVSYSLIWLPQIVRSVRRGRTSGLAREYVLGTTICRLYLALCESFFDAGVTTGMLTMYVIDFLACPKNVLDVEPRCVCYSILTLSINEPVAAWSYILAAFVCFQAIIVLLQEVLGPTFFLSRKVVSSSECAICIAYVYSQYATVKTYDYHPPMPLPDSEAPEQSLGDCAICMDAIRLDRSGRHQSEKGTSGEWDREAMTPDSSRRVSLGSPGGLLSAMHMGMESPGTRKVYSLAPCHHLFVGFNFFSFFFLLSRRLVLIRIALSNSIQNV
jgi:transmembrane E3 ubiquitin-protein ligase